MADIADRDSEIASPSSSDPASLLADAPRELFPTATDMFDVAYDDVRTWQLQALARRHGELCERVRMLGRLTDRAGVTSIDSLDDGARLLYPSDVYKSYSHGWLLDGDFTRLTRWMQQLTTVDLGGLEVDDVDSIDGWLAALDAGTALSVCHSSATSGKLSFVPRSEVEWRRRATTMPFASEAAGNEEGPRRIDLGGRPIITPYYRAGSSAFSMSVEWNIRVHGDPDRVETLYPGRLSSDLLVVAAQLRQAGGGRLPDDPRAFDSLPAWLTERWDDLRNLVAEPGADDLATFVRRTAERYRNEPIWLIGVWPSLVDAAMVAVAEGVESVFAADSVIHTGGGSKGRDLPDDAEEQVLRWLGVPEIRGFYGMSEIAGQNVLCRSGKYHLNAWTIPYVFDTDGTVLPATGTQRGRFGGIDLLAETYWGGYLSTDLVALTWDPGCACGRKGPYMDRSIARVSDGLDDKVSCAATPALADDAVTVLASLGSDR